MFLGSRSGRSLYLVVVFLVLVGCPPVFGTVTPGNALLHSLIVPGWGQKKLGRTGWAKVFLASEVASLSLVGAFYWRSRLVRSDYQLYARAYSGLGTQVPLSEHVLRSLEDYQSRVQHLEALREEARTRYPEDMEKQVQYIQGYDIGVDWAWDEGKMEGYRVLRKRARKSQSKSIQFTGLIVCNHILSALLSARQAAAADGEGSILGRRVDFLATVFEPGLSNILAWGFRCYF